MHDESVDIENVNKKKQRRKWILGQPPQIRTMWDPPFDDSSIVVTDCKQEQPRRRRHSLHELVNLDFVAEQTRSTFGKNF